MEKFTEGEIIVGWNGGLTGPTTGTDACFCGGKDWPYIPISQGYETIAVVPAQSTTRARMGRGEPVVDSEKANAARIVECWNACEGVTGLQPGAVKEMIDFITEIAADNHDTNNYNYIISKATAILKANAG